MTVYKPIGDLKSGDSLKQVFFIGSVKASKTKAGKPYARLALKDNSGQIDVNVWELDLTKNPEVKPDVFILLEVEIEDFKGSRQGKAKGMPMVVNAPEDVSAYESKQGLSDEQIEKEWSYLASAMDQVKDPFIKAYLATMFSENTLLEKFKNGAASFSNRGAFRGGLIQHVAKVMKNALALLDAQQYEKANKDLVIAGVMAHDIAKALVYIVTPTGVTTSRADRLIGHLAMSYAISTHTWIAVESALHREVPEETKDLINSIVLSHHGDLSHGSPVKPQFLEAWIVHISDYMDSSTTNFVEQTLSRPVDNFGFAQGNFVTGRIFVQHYGKS